MPKSTLLISDPHLTSKPEDAYRWEIFPLVKRLIKEHDLLHVYLLGDLTDSKSGHSADLVNRIVDGILTWSCPRVVLLAGNHDLVGTNSQPFFEFLGKYDRIEFITEPGESATLHSRHLYLPHTRTPEDDWQDIDFTDRIVYAHVSVKGAVYETGTRQEHGISPDVFKPAKAAFSGDIHSPSQVGALVYVGCPYRVRFNDSFRGGGILLDPETGEWERIYFDEFPRRFTWNITTASDLKAHLKESRPKDQVKIRLHLDKNNMGRWKDIVQETKIILSDADLVLHKLETVRTYNEVLAQAPRELRKTDFDSFCDSQQITGEIKEVGRLILEEALAS